MKRFSLICLVLITFFNCQAQTRITFKGIDLNCTVKELAKELEKQGYESSQSILPSMYHLKGTFAGEYADISVIGADKSLLVIGITVSFKKEDTWTSLEKKYQAFKSSLDDKYGKGESTEMFKDPYRKGDGNELDAVRTGNCIFKSIYRFDNGSIVLMISNDCSLTISYLVDSKKNQEQQRQNDL